MSIEKGSKGVITAGGSVVGELISFTYTGTSAEENTAVAGADEARPRGTQRSSSGSCEAYFDESDAGQAAMAEGAVVGLEMRPEGTGAGLPQAAVSEALITDIEVTVNAQEAAYNRATFTWSGNAIDRTPQA